MIYLDNSATTRTLDAAAEAAFAAMTKDYFNPSGAYRASVQVEKQVISARNMISKALKVLPSEIVFTSGGTESNNMAVLGSIKHIRGKRRIITTQVEHPSVYELFRSLDGAEQNEVIILPVDDKGYVRIDALKAELTPDTALVSIMHVNNELGTINDLALLADIIYAKAPNAIFHSDGVQAFLKLPLQKPPVDLYSASGHKFHAPKGVGFLYVNNRIRFAGGQIGGGQENNLRSGTTNVPSILAMEIAVSTYVKNIVAWHQNMSTCKKRLYKNLSVIPNVILNGPSIEEGAPHILNMSFDGVRGEVLLHALEQKDICVATGSACSSHKKGKNRILSAVGIMGSRQEGALRFSLCPFNTIQEMDVAAQVVCEQVNILRRYRRR